MELIADPDTKQAIKSLFADSSIAIGDLVQGEKVPVSVSVAKRIPVPSTSRYFDPQDISAWTVRVGLGDVTALPLAGYGTLSWSTDTTSGLAAEPTAQEIEDALNAGTDMTAAGGIDVIETDAANYFLATFRSVGARDDITGDAAGYAPLSIIETGTLITGDASTKAVQFIRIHQQPAAFANLTTDSAAASVGVEVLTTGGSGANHKVRITAPLSIDGSFTLNLASIETGFIGYNSSAADFVTALEALQQTSGTVVSGQRYKIITFATGDDFTNIGAASNADGVVFDATGTTPTTWTNGSVLSPVGSGNVSVIKESDSQWVVMFIGDMADVDMGTITGDASTLVVPVTKSGYIDLRVPGVQLLLSGAAQISTIFEVEGTPSGGAPQKLIRQSNTLYEGLIDPSSTPPQPIPGGHIVQTDDIASTDTFKVITFSTALATPPSSVKPTLIVPTGEGGFDIWVIKGSISETGYTVGFGGSPDSEDYQIQTDATI